MADAERNRVVILVIMGVAGCGKSTVGKRAAEQLCWPFYDGDDFHTDENIRKMACGTPLTTLERLPWLQTIHAHMKSSVNAFQNAVYACSALKQTYRDILRRDLPHVRFVYLKASRQTILQRLRSRSHFAGPQLLPSQFRDLEEPHEALIIDCEQSIDKTVSEIAAFVLQVTSE